MYQTPRIGIDTIRFITTQDALEKLMNKLNLEYEKKVSVSLINRFKKEILKSDKRVKKKDFNLEVISISKDKSLLGYLLVKNNYKSISISKKQKRANNYKKELIFTSLNQPTKKHHIEHLNSSYEVLKHFINRFKLDTLDLSIDGLTNFSINQFYDLFNEYINHKSNIQIVNNSFYINNPINPNNPRFNFEKILIYNKYQKESRQKVLDVHFRNWNRLEVTIQISKENLNTSLVDDMVESIQYLTQLLFLNSKLDENFLIEQQKQLGFRV